MSIPEIIKSEYPEIANDEFHPTFGSILICDDGDGIQYIAKWDYPKPLPKGLKVGK